MRRFLNFCSPVLLLATLSAVGCAQTPTAPTDSATTATATEAKPGASLPVGSYEMTFLHDGAEVTTLPAGQDSNIQVRVIVRDSNGQLAADGTVLFEVCKWRGVSPTTGTRGGAAPSSACANGTARWERHISLDVRPSPLITFTALTGIDIVNVACVMGWRATYKNSRTIAPGVMGPADFTWYVE